MSNDSWKTSWANAQKKKEEVDMQEPSWKASWDKAQKTTKAESIRYEQTIREGENYFIQKRVANSPGALSTHMAQEEAKKQQEEANEQYNNEVSEWAKDNGLGFLGNGVGYTLGKTAMGVSDAFTSMSEALTSVLGNVQTGAEHVKSWVTGAEKPTDFAEQIRLIEDLAVEFNGLDDLTYDEVAQYIKDETGKDVSRLALAAYDMNAKKQGANEFVDTMYAAQNDGEIGTGTRFAGNIGYGIGNMAPSIALAVTSGGTSTAGEAAGAIPTLVDALKNGASVGSAAASAAKALFTFSASTAVMSAQSAGDKYVTSAREYGTGEFPGATLMNAIGTGAIEGVTENLGGITGFTKLGDMLNKEMTGSILANVAQNLPNLLVNAGEEGMEEIIASPLEGLLDKAFLDNGKPLVGWGNGAAIDGKEMLDSGMTGTAIGLVMGTVLSTSSVIQSSADIQDKIKIVNNNIDAINHAYQGAYGVDTNVVEKLPNKATLQQVYEKFDECVPYYSDMNVVPHIIDYYSNDFLSDPLNEGCQIAYDSMTGATKIIGADGYAYDSRADYYAGIKSEDQSMATAQNGAPTQAETDADAYRRYALESGNPNADVSGADIATGIAQEVQIPSEERLREIQEASSGQYAQTEGFDGAPSSDEFITALKEYAQRRAEFQEQENRKRQEELQRRSEHLSTLARQTERYARTGATFEETISELSRSGLITYLHEDEDEAISDAWRMGNAAYRVRTGTRTKRLPAPGETTTGSQTTTVSEKKKKAGNLSEVVRPEIRRAMNAMKGSGRLTLATYDGNTYVCMTGGALLITQEEAAAMAASGIKQDKKAEKRLAADASYSEGDIHKATKAEAFSESGKSYVRLELDNGSAITVKKAAFDDVNKEGFVVGVSTSGRSLLAISDGTVAAVITPNSGVRPGYGSKNVKLKCNQEKPRAKTPKKAKGNVGTNASERSVATEPGRRTSIEEVCKITEGLAREGKGVIDTIGELVNRGLITDINNLSKNEIQDITFAWNQGNLDYKAEQKKHAGEVGVRGKGERAETTGQSVSGKKTKKPTAKPSASDGSGKKSTTQAKGETTTETAGKAEGTTKPVKREGTAKGGTTARTDSKPNAAEENGSETVAETTAAEKKTGVETAKRKLKESENYTAVKDLGKVAKSIYDRITGEGLSFSDVTLRNPPAGFNKAQQEQIVRSLLNTDEAVGESTRIELIGDGTFTFSNDAVSVSQMLSKLGVRLSDSADVTVRAGIRKAVNSLNKTKAGRKVLGTYNGNNYIVFSHGAFLITDGEKTFFENDSRIEKNADEYVTRALPRFEKSVRETAVEVSSVVGFTKGKENFARIKFSNGSAMTVKRAEFDALNEVGQTVLASPVAHGMIATKDGVLTGVVLEYNADPVGDETFIRIKFDTPGKSSTTAAKSSGKQYSLTDTATPRRQYKAKRTPSASGEATVSESKADKPQSEAAKPKSAEAAVETGAGDGNKAISMQDVIDKIQEDFGVQITRGYMRDVPKQASGRYDTVNKGVRYRTANDVNTVSHELGHALDDRYHILTEDTDLAVLKWFANTLPADRAVAYSAAYGLSGEGADFYLPLAKEGLADRLADYLTDAESALKQYPKFKKYFLDPIRKKKGGKADLARLERYAEMVHEAVTNDEARLRGTVHTIEKPKRTDSLVEGIRRSFREGTPEERKEYRISSGKHKVDSFITTFFSKNQYIKTLGQQSNSGSCETYVDLQNATYNTGLIESAMRGKMTDLDGKPIGEGFHVILEGLTDKNGHLDPDLYHEFGLYLDIVHSAERQEQGHKIPQTMEKALEDGTIERMEEAHPDFPELADKVYEFSNNLLDVAVQGGLVEPEVVEKWREIYPHYVPMQRYFDQQTRESKGGAKATNPRGFANVNSPYKRAKGSQLDYYNPLDLIIQQTATVYQSAIHNRIMRSIVDLVKDSPNPAILMERIPDDLHITKISTKEILERLEYKGIKTQAKAAQRGADIEADAMDDMMKIILDAIPDSLSKVEKGTHTDASRRIVTVMENGKKVMYKVNDPDLFKVIVNMNPTRDSAFVRLISTVSRGVVKMWTSLNPLFSFSNAARDLGTLTSSMATEFGGEIAVGKNDRHISLKNRAALMAQMYKNIGKSWAETAKERAEGLESTDPYHQEYIAMGGNESGLADDARYMSVDVRKEFSKENARKYGKLSKLKQGYAVLSFTTNMVERGPREAVYITAREMGLEPKLAYRLSQDVTTDFKNGGTLKGVSTFIPLFNAGLAGIYRAGRHWTGEHITSDYKIDPMTSKTRQKRAMGRILASVILSAAMAALQTLLGSADEEKYKQLSNYTKNNFMCIPKGDGNFITIPKPREWAALQSVFERAAEAVFLGNEYALDGSDTWEYLTDMFLPNGISSLAQGDLMGALGTIAGVGPLFEVAANKDYLGRDIVPVSLQDKSPKYQYNENTSWLAWAIGQILPISPLQIDHIGRNWAGGWWELMKGLTPNGLFRNGDTSNVSFALSDRWYRDAAYSTDIINRMYEYRDKANVAHNDNEDDIDAKIDYTWYDRMASFYSAYNKLAKIQPDSAQKRATRQTVLDMIEGSLEVKDGKVYSAQAELEDYVRRTGDTLAMPATMATEFKYGKNNSKVMTLDADQYVEFQLLYNTYYWNYIQQLFSSAYADKLSDASLKKSLHSARDRALTKAKQDIINKATKEK